MVGPRSEPSLRAGWHCVGMARFTRAELQSYRGVTVPDLVGPGLRLLFVGINPGLWTAATQTHFARPGNRFYPALLLAGIIDRTIDPGAGMTDDDRAYLVSRGIGISNLARRRRLAPTSSRRASYARAQRRWRSSSYGSGRWW